MLSFHSFILSRVWVIPVIIPHISPLSGFKWHSIWSLTSHKTGLDSECSLLGPSLSNWVMFGFTIIISSQDCNPPWHMCNVTWLRWYRSLMSWHLVTCHDVNTGSCIIIPRSRSLQLTVCSRAEEWIKSEKAMTRCNNNKTELGTVLCAPSLHRVPREQSCHATTEPRELKKWFAFSWEQILATWEPGATGTMIRLLPPSTVH